MLYRRLMDGRRTAATWANGCSDTAEWHCWNKGGDTPYDSRPRNCAILIVPGVRLVNPMACSIARLGRAIDSQLVGAIERGWTGALHRSTCNAELGNPESG